MSGLVRFFTLLLILGFSTNCLATAQEKPNILFVAVDDLKPLTTHYGNQKVKTPTLDKLASRSRVFTRAYTQYPVCGPSRTSLLTGLRPESNGVMDLKTRMRDVNPDIVTLPQFFKNQGYQTAAVGKVFDPRNVDSRDTDDPASWSIPYRKSSSKADRKGKHNFAVRSINAPSDQFIDGDINQRGIKLLREMANDSQPFFLAVGYKKPHLPFAVPSRFFDLYDRDSFDLEPYQLAPKDSDGTYILNNNNELMNYVPMPVDGGNVVNYNAGNISAVQQRELMHGYYAAVSFIDSLVAELLAELDASGRADNTIIVIWGDHGFHLGDHGLWGKHTTMEQANRVPLMIHVPGMSGGDADTLVELLDLFPTLAELAGLEAPAHLQGKSLSGVLNDPDVDFADVAISQYKRKGAYGYSMRTSQYRYTEWVKPDGDVAYRDLYDLQNDPGETRNIGSLPENRSLMDRLAVMLRENGEGLLRLK